MKCLIVEDDRHIQNMLKTLLTIQGWECNCVLNGIGAIDAFAHAHKDKEPYDLIFMDIMMPCMDGLEALKQIREIETELGIEEEVKIIMLTALNDPDTVFNAYYEGRASAYIPKPFGQEDIIRELNKLGF
ncbi:MAG: response regulator [Candidatus Eremiobacterota bacterium]